MFMHNKRKLICACMSLVLAGVFAERKLTAEPLSDMISPVTHPVVFEDPRQSTEIRPLFAHHEIDDKFVTEGGNANIYAIQARVKLTDDFSIIANKDGYVDLNTRQVVPKNGGFANLAAGGKYTIWSSGCAILSGGLTYEIPTGQNRVLQGHGDGAFNPFIAYGATYDGWNFMGTTGFRAALDNNDSSFYDLNLHVSYKVGNFYPLMEFGLVNVIDNGNRLPIPDEGEDFFNLGASDSSGKTITTWAVGARYRITDKIDVGAAWQFPLDRSTGTRIIDNRVTADMIFRFDI